MSMRPILRIRRADGGEREKKNEPKTIGTRNESSLHAALKEYLEPDRERREVRVGPYIADISNDEGITEIQTRNFATLYKKLEVLLSAEPVTVVYPVAHVKHVYWVDPKTGERTGGRKSPKIGKPCELLRELPALRSLLPSPRLRFRVLLLEIEEYRYKNGWDPEKKRGATRMDRVLVRILDEVRIDGMEDYGRLLPPGLPEGFSSREFGKIAGLSLPIARDALLLLHRLALVDRIGRDRRGYLYKIHSD